MAQFFTGFSAFDVGVLPPEFVPTWGDNNRWRIVTGGAGGTNNRQVRYDGVSPALLQWTRPGVVLTDAELVVRFWGDVTWGIGIAALRTAGERVWKDVAYINSGDARGYTLGIESPPGADARLVLYRITTGYPLALASTPFPWAAKRWYLARFRVNGTNLKAKVWADGDAEPGAWMLETADATWASGGVGLWSGYVPNNAYDFINVATAGDTAAVGGTEPGPVVPPVLSVIAGVQDITMYEEDDTTPFGGAIVDPDTGEILQALYSTHPDHPRPWLAPIVEAADSSINFRDPGSSIIGMLRLEWNDQPTIDGDQDSGHFTSIMHVRGKDRIVGRRVVVRQQAADGTWAILMDGPMSGPELTEDKAGYWTNAKDIRERERALRLFTRASSTSLFPAGVVKPYGVMQYRDSSMSLRKLVLVPETDGHPGLTENIGASLGLYQARIKLDIPKVGWTEWSADNLARLQAYGRPIPVYEQGGYRDVHDGVVVEWKPEAGGEWKRLERMPVMMFLSIFSGEAPNVFQTTDGTIDIFTNPNASQRALRYVVMNSFNPDDLPAHNARVKVRVIANLAPTDDVPLWGEGNLGQLLKDAYDGKYSEPGAPTIRYNPDAMQRLIDRNFLGRWKIPELASNGLAWLGEHVYKVIGYAPALDEQFRINPVSGELPSADDDVTEFNDNNTEPGAGWRRGPEDIVTRVTFSYQRDYVIPNDPANPRSTYERMRQVDQPLERIHANASLHGERTVSFKPETMRAVTADPGGSKRTPEGVVETGRETGERRANDLMDRFSDGTPRTTAVSFMDQVTIFDPLLNGGLGGVRRARVGDWGKVSLSWLPDPVTGRRGCNRMMQILAMRPLDGIAAEYDLADAGPWGQPLPQVTVTDVQTELDGRISVVVGALPYHGDRPVEARVEYAVSGTEPARLSDEWKVLTRTGTPGKFYSPQIPTDAVVWVRWRGERSRERASSWHAAVTLVMPVVARITGVRLAIDPETGIPTVTWEPLPTAAAVRIFYAVHAPGTAVPAQPYGASLDRAVGNLSAPLPVTLRQREQVSVYITAYPGWSGAAATGTAGESSNVVTAQFVSATVLMPHIKPVPSEEAETGTLVLDVSDPQRRVYLYEFQTQIGIEAPSAWVADAVAPYQASVVKVEKHVSRINWRVTGIDATGTYGVISQGTVSFNVSSRAVAPAVATTVDSLGNVSAVATGDAYTAAYKVKASKLGIPSASDIRTTGTIVVGRVAVISNIILLGAGERAFVAVLPYRDAACTIGEGERGHAPADHVSATGTGSGDTHPPNAYINTVSETQSQETISYSGALGLGGIGPLMWRRRIDVAGTPGAWSTQVNLPAANESVARHADKLKRVYLEIEDGDSGAKVIQSIEVESAAARAAGGVIDPTATGGVKPGTVIVDPAGNRPLSRGHQRYLKRHGDVITFDPPFTTTPVVIIHGNGLVFEPAAGGWLSTTRKYRDVAALNLTPSGMEVRARLRQKGVPTAREVNFPSGVNIMAGDHTDYEGLAIAPIQTDLLANAPAADDTYTIHYDIQLEFDVIGEPGYYYVHIGLESYNDATGLWTPRGGKGYTLNFNGSGTESQFWPDESIAVTVGGMDANDRFRLVVDNMIISVEFGASFVDNLTVRGWRKVGGGDPNAGVEFQSASGETYVSMTPDPEDRVIVDAFEVSGAA